jgi:hypothetical protein
MRRGQVFNQLLGGRGLDAGRLHHPGLRIRAQACGNAGTQL